MTPSVIDSAITDGVATVVLNRPDARNALSIELRDQISELLMSWHDEARGQLVCGACRGS